ncbi:MAG TPA: PrsW family glutamic-type intramembrane protease [Chitinophaga sp.]|uniref:PrsW family intramembrane metalloprotease n=1 Tax=Chitinophaga sp. TaxID=1869181 RepID=UPI002BAAE5C0|nr:PrsW family glutamic-type intramembrane protease [Chitinophaga sp.]HVI47711.1 PrsW family glutamic-type intramembrane protease [Chitinophaga sp.]
MMLLALAVAPGFAISLFIYLMDRYDREPVGLLLKCFLLGMACVVLPLVIQTFAASLGFREDSGSLIGTAAFAYGVVGFSEELAKFLVLRYVAYPNKAFNEPLDGIVYAVMIGMGFATLENIAYVSKYGVGTGIARMFLSVPAHATFAVLMGYYAGFAKFARQRETALLFRGWLIAVFFHGTYDFFLFTGNNILTLGASVITLFIAIRLSAKAIRKNKAISRQLNEQHYFEDNA